MAKVLSGQLEMVGQLTNVRVIGCAKVRPLAGTDNHHDVRDNLLASFIVQIASDVGVHLTDSALTAARY
jgi:hypothetical protein